MEVEETWYLMKRKPQWTFEHSMRDIECWHESIRNKYGEKPSAEQLNTDEEDEEKLPVEVKEEEEDEEETTHVENEDWSLQILKNG